ncbi:MAG TPA: alkaline phosphatase family protein [Labilithrix sp.]|nr:alkaline phosphatase family protein [Labilithrix sp.]
MTPPSPLVEAKNGVDAPVVVVTIDGVRWQEIFDGTDPTLAPGPRVPATKLVPNLYALGTERGAFVGAPGSGVISATGPEYLSLPGYSEIFHGRFLHGCRDNDCARTTSPTLLDEARGRGATVAAFASWTKLDFALTSNPGAFLVSCGPHGGSALPGGTGLDDSRPDHDTATAALAYYEAERPDVFHLGLGEPDEHAHFGNYVGYIAALRDADEVVGRLMAMLDRDERGRKTHVVVMPDHGRARDFRSHGGFAPEAARVWMVVAGPRVAARGFVGSPRPRHLADVAPTLRMFLGLPSDMAPSAGSALDELFVSPPSRSL